MTSSIRLSSIASFLLSVTMSCTQKKPVEEFVPELYDPTYALATPQDWGVERFGIPIEFAPTIPYSGVEDIRFTPGWADASSTSYWSYAFLWYLDGKPEITPRIIETNLAAYYNGLIGRNIDKRKIPSQKTTDVAVAIKETRAIEGDLKTYSGSINMLDYMAQSPMILNCIVHIKSCPEQPDKTFIFYEISPQPFTSDVWTELHSLWTTFECTKPIVRSSQ